MRSSSGVISSRRATAASTAARANCPVYRSNWCRILAGSTRIHLHQLSPGARSLVPEFGKERVPSGVVDRAGQYSARKSFDVQVFHRDQPVAFHQPAAEIMMKGGTLVSDFTVRLGH